jgi:hypothetical protein
MKNAFLSEEPITCKSCGALESDHFGIIGSGLCNSCIAVINPVVIQWIESKEADAIAN